MPSPSKYSTRHAPSSSRSAARARSRSSSGPSFFGHLILNAFFLVQFRGMITARVKREFPLFFHGTFAMSFARGSLSFTFSCSLMRRQEQANRNPKDMGRARRKPRGARASNRRSGAQARGAAPQSSRALEKRQRADFDALARPRVGRRGRVFERGVGGPAGAAVLRRIEDFEHQRLLAPHTRQPVPAVLGIVGDGVGLADPVRV